MGNLRKWLQSRNEENLMGKTVAFVKKVLECVVEFERGFNFFADEKNHQLALEVLERVDQLEHEADVMRRELLQQITKSDMPPNTREDLARLVTGIDRIANTTNSAGRRLSQIDEKNIRILGDEIITLLFEMIQHSLEATKILFNLIKRFPDLESKDVFPITENIQRLEHKCDVIHSEIYRKLNHLPITNVSMNPFIAMELKDIIDIFEEISDKVEDVADYIELLKTVLR
jgi:predicted phosphate transport protein (TIGR00153 family)